MRHAAFAGILGLAALLPHGADAQVSYNRPNGGLGGGFLELMMTGRDPGRPAAGPAAYGPQQPYARPGRMQAAPQPYSGGAYDPFADIDPMTRSRPRVASLPDAGMIERAPRAQFQRQEVAYDGTEAPGTIVVDTPSKYLYHVLPGGRAIRYGIGVGRPGFEWSGIKSVTMKKEWPDWRPPPEMRKRRPDLPMHMVGGPGNPLGARALYLGSSLYRIHGTNEPHTIGQNVSSGCIRMMNDDVIHLYGRVGVGTRVKVI